MSARLQASGTPTGQLTESCDPAGRVTRSLLGYGVLAGPCYVVVVLLQAWLRTGFDLWHDDVSLLSNGSHGWIQRANFAITGLMVIACAIGIQRAVGAGRSARWGSRLLGLYGLGLVGAAIFSADPMIGFPPGTPPGRPSTVSLQGTLHVVVAAIGFLGLIASTFVLAQWFARHHERSWVLTSRVTGILFLAGFAGLASGSSSALAVLGFWLALLVAWVWLAAIAVHFYRQVGRRVSTGDGSPAR